MIYEPELVSVYVLYVLFPDGEERLLHMQGTPAIGETFIDHVQRPAGAENAYVVASVEWRFSGGVGAGAFWRRYVVLAQLGHEQ